MGAGWHITITTGEMNGETKERDGKEPDSVEQEVECRMIYDTVSFRKVFMVGWVTKYVIRLTLKTFWLTRILYKYVSIKSVVNEFEYYF